ncbi:hypothetical protein Pcinc_044400, partial [Petrolisthes cinctipes]
QGSPDKACKEGEAGVRQDTQGLEEWIKQVSKEACKEGRQRMEVSKEGGQAEDGGENKQARKDRQRMEERINKQGRTDRGWRRE